MYVCVYVCIYVCILRELPLYQVNVSFICVLDTVSKK